MVRVMCRTKENKMKRFLILIVLVLAGCGEAEDTAKVNRCLEAGDVCVQINNALIISEQQGKLLNNLKLITDQQAEIIVGTYETKFVTGPALSDTRLKENVEDKKPRKKKTTAKARDLRVDPAIGDDSNDGSTSPLKSIRQAIRIAKAGDTIHLKPVVYHQYAGFYGKRGEPGNPITLDGHGAVLEGSEAIQPASWTEVAPGLFKNDQLMPTLNLAILWRWFFLFDGKINRMGRVLKGKSEPFLKPAELKPGEWTFVGNHKKPKGGSDSDKVQGSFFLKIKPGQTLKQANIRFPIRSAGVQFSGENAHLVIRNLTATHQYNDGFNIHGDCRDVVFENIQAIECGDDGISAHETAQYRVDGFVSIGNGTGICDTGSSQTSYNNLFIADCVGVDLYFLHTGTYSISNAIVLSSAQKPMVVSGDANGRCTMKIDNLYLRRTGNSATAIVATNSSVAARRLTLDKLDLRVTGEMSFDACLINGRPNPPATKSPGADLDQLIKTVVPKSYQSQFCNP
tara:strand:- start:1554 stop:3089 length:1536 start_codon:yes stop_codon:yes gene_type:complete